MDKKQILKISLSILFVGATVTTAAYVMKYNICPRIKFISYNGTELKIKWAGKDYSLGENDATHLSWTAKLEDAKTTEPKVKVYNKKGKLIRTYNVNQEL